MGKNVVVFIGIVVVVGLLLLGVAALLGWIARMVFSLPHNYGLYVGYVLAGLTVAIALWGCVFGFADFVTQRVTLVCEGLPREFDGYRIILITDAHLGSFVGREGLWSEAVDAMLAEDADLIVFTGDLQNREPDEIGPFVPDMARLRARDGVFAVLGNHDYGYPATLESPRKVREAEESAGWRVLVNERVEIVRGGAHIILAGMDNDGDGRHFPQRGNIGRTLNGTAPDDFIIMLEHDPTSWRRRILPDGRARLTLSGHTHAMQFGIFGWSPSKWIYDEWRGLFSENGRQLYVSSGVGGVVPFRLGMPREMVVLELKSAGQCL